MNLRKKFSSCGTVFTGAKSKIYVTANSKEPVTLIVDGKKYKNVPGNTPTRVKVKKGYRPSLIQASNDKEFGNVVVEKRFNTISIINAFNPLGWFIDLLTGAVTTADYSDYVIPMQPVEDK